MITHIHSPFWRTTILCIAVGLLSAGTVFAITKGVRQNNTNPSSDEIISTKAAGTHAAYPQAKADIEKNFENVGANNFTHVRAVVVNHHLLAGNLIAKTLASITDTPDTIILLSPNHFELGNGAFTTSNYDWSSVFGNLHANTKFIDTLVSSGLVQDPRIFPNEHGVTNLIPYITYAFPNSTIVPIAIKTGVSDETLEAFSKSLSSLTTEKTLIIASVDFSHSLDARFAEFHDTQAQAVLASLDTTGVKKTDVDSSATLSLLFRTLQKIDVKKFTLLEHSNAASITQNPSMTDVTSYLTGVYQKDTPSDAKSITIFSVGDTMLDRYVRKHIETEGLDSYFDANPRVWLGTDITLANLEGCFTDFPHAALDPDSLSFTFDPDWISTLKKYNFTTFSLANNHSLNFGSKGFSQCTTYLQNNTLDFFGHPTNAEHLSTIVTVRNVTIGFVGYNALEKTKLGDITDEITRIRPSVDYLIVAPHWGNEYHDTPSATQKQAAHAMIDAGADVILGTHPHVIQPIEEYKGKMIFYSLGNFIFDQMFSEETRTGLTVGINLTSNGASFWLYPISNADFTIDFLEGEKRDTLLKELSKNSEVSDGLKSEIQNGHIN